MHGSKVKKKLNEIFNRRRRRGKLENRIIKKVCIGDFH
jgi:hypothetical protein